MDVSKGIKSRRRHRPSEVSETLGLWFPAIHSLNRASNSNESFEMRRALIRLEPVSCFTRDSLIRPLGVSSTKTSRGPAKSAITVSCSCPEPVSSFALPVMAYVPITFINVSTNTFLPLLPSPYKNANFCSFTSPVSVYPAQRIKNDSRLGSGVPSRREDTSRTCSCQCGHSASGSHGTAADCVQYDIRACCSGTSSPVRKSSVPFCVANKYGSESRSDGSSEMLGTDSARRRIEKMRPALSHEIAHATHRSRSSLPASSACARMSAMTSCIKCTINLDSSNCQCVPFHTYHPMPCTNLTLSPRTRASRNAVPNSVASSTCRGGSFTTRTDPGPRPRSEGPFVPPVPPPGSENPSLLVDSWPLPVDSLDASQLFVLSTSTRSPFDATSLSEPCAQARIVLVIGLASSSGSTRSQIRSIFSSTVTQAYGAEPSLIPPPGVFSHRARSSCVASTLDTPRFLSRNACWLKNTSRVPTLGPCNNALRYADSVIPSEPPAPLPPVPAMLLPPRAKRMHAKS